MSPRSRWLLLWSVLAAFVVARATDRPDHRGVILDHLEFGRRLLASEDVYAPWKSDLDAPHKPLHAPYPPSFGLLTAPFAEVNATLGLAAARASWALLQIAALVGLYVALRRMPRGPTPPSEREHRWLFLLTLVVLARLVLRDTHGGGGNLINVSMCALAFADAERGRSVRAGWWLGFSLATKPTQALLLPLLWCQGHRKTVLHALVAGTGFALLSFALAGFDTGPWARWFEGSLALARQVDAFAPPALQWPAFEWMNQSLRCAVARWFGDVPLELAARVNWGVSQGLGLSAATCGFITRGANLSLLLLVLHATCKSRRTLLTDLASTSAAARRSLQFAAVLALSLLVSPISWKAHHVALVPMIYLLLAEAWRRRSRALFALVAAWFVACGIGKEILGDDGDEWLNSTYLLTIFDIILIAVALRRSNDIATPRA